MLLTSSSISMGISSFIVFVFTSALFLSGYILQQQTVRNLQSIIKPLPPKSPPTTSSSAPAPTQLLLATTTADVDWSTVAFAQLVSEPSLVCEAVMHFAVLERHNHQAQRVLLYPRTWDKRRTGERTMVDTTLSTARRLLDQARLRYGVQLMPMDPLFEGIDVTDPRSYAMPQLLSIPYKQVLRLGAPTLLLDPELLDQLVAYEEASTYQTLPSLILAKPSPAQYTRLVSLYSTVGHFPSHSEQTALLHKTFPNHTLPFPLQDLVLRTSALTNDADLSAAAYVVFDDADGLEPRFDISGREMGRVRPPGMAGTIWDKLWENYREERRGVCGLDLQRWDGVGSQGMDGAEIEL